ncbi:MAG: hypothetical protein Pars2KO_25400 [Parasphingorhabdus sp.]
MKLLAPVLIVSALAAGGFGLTQVEAGKKSSKDDKYVIKTIGEPKSCVRRSRIRSTEVVDNSTIDFKMRGGKIYRNKLPHKCSGLAFEEAFSYRTSTDNLCNVDIIRVLDQTAGRIEERSACGLGKFQEIEKTRKDRVES